jgi:HEAT repeat protein
MRRWSGYLLCIALGALSGILFDRILVKRDPGGSRERERGHPPQIGSPDPVAGPGERASPATVAAQEKVSLPASTGEASSSDREPVLSEEEIRALIRKGDRQSSARAARSIVEVKGLPAQLALVRELFTYGHPSARYAALVIGDSGRWPPEAADLWCVILREESHPEILSRAAASLARMGNPVAIPALETAFREGEWRLQKDAAIALEKLGRAGAREQMVAKLVPRLSDPDGSVRRTAVAYLGELGTASALPHLGETLSDADSDLRWGGVRALRQTGLKAAIPYLERALGDPKPSIAEEARRLIQELHGSGR